MRGAHMISIPAYFDGNAVKTLETYPFEKNQRLIITILDDTTAWANEKQDTDRRLSLLDGLQKYRGRLSSDFDAEKEHPEEHLIKSLRGCLSESASPELIETEKDAWATAAREKHGIR